MNERKVRNWLRGKTRPAAPERAIAYAATKAAEMAARLRIEGGDPFESYRTAKEHARTKLTAMPKSALKMAGFSGSEIAGIKSGSYRPAFGRIAPDLITV